MSAADEQARLVESAVAGLYGGPLEDFVRRRDALAKELRSAGERESATTIKGLRKPSRIAWALDLGAQHNQSTIEELVAAVAEMLAAQGAGGDVRAATTRLRAAVRDFASRAADAAEQAGHRIQPGALVNAVLAVLGRPESFDRLRGGYLADVPEAGGLDFLAALPALPDSRAAPAKPSKGATAPTPSPKRAGRERAARDAAQRAASLHVQARNHAQTAQQALRDAESKLHEAEARLRHAEEKVRSARSEWNRARQEAEAAAGRLVEVERAAAEAERQVDGA